MKRHRQGFAAVWMALLMLVVVASCGDDDSTGTPQSGSIAGTVIGVLIIGVINNGLDLLNVTSYYQQIIKGVIIVSAVLLDRKNSH